MFTYIKNILTQKCPRCHESDLFTHKWYDFKNNTKMKSSCSVCGQRTELEPGFYHGTGYVSYALTVGFSIITFVLWIAITHIGIGDKRVFWWLVIDVVSLIALQPWLMRISRVLWLSWFFHDDDHLFMDNEKKETSKTDNLELIKGEINIVESKI